MQPCGLCKFGRIFLQGKWREGKGDDFCLVREDFFPNWGKRQAYITKVSRDYRYLIERINSENR